MTANDLLVLARQAFPTEGRFVWCSARHVHPVPATVEPGDRVRLAGLDAIVTEWTCDEHGRRLRADLGAWVPRSLIRAPWVERSFRRETHQPTPPPQKWRA